MSLAPSVSVPTFTAHLGLITDFGLHFRPDVPALAQPGLELTYRQLDSRINQVANGVQTAGIKSGERVLILWENDIRFVETTLGVIRSGAVAVPVNPRLSPQAHGRLLEDSGARMIMASRTTLRSAAELAELVVLAIGLDADIGTPGLVDYEDWLSAQVDTRPNVVVDPEALAWLAYTSGSTGKPKGVMLPHRMLLRDAQLVAQCCFISSADRAIVATPLFHMNAAACGLLPALYSGASVYVLPAFDPGDVLRGIEEQRCTYTTGVPAMYKLMLACTEELSRDFSSLRMIACGSAPMPPALIEQLSVVFPNAQFTEGYGLTECGPAATLGRPHGPRRPGSIGLPLPGFEVRLVGEEDKDVPAGEVGEMWLRGPCTSLGYLDRPEEDAMRRKPDGWFATGDLATQDHEGWLYFRGRADDMMSVGGENVYPAEVESALARHPLVRDVAVVPMPHQVKGEVPVAYVVMEPSASITEAELQQFFLEAGPAHAHPRRITFLDAMPLAATGKTDRRRLADMTAESASGTPTLTPPSTPSQEN